MKIVTMLLATVFSIFFAGSSISAPALPADPPRMGIGASSALMKALKSPQAEMLIGHEGIGIAEIYVQPRDGESTVRNVEALNTIYFITEHELYDGVLVIFEADKTSNSLRLLNYWTHEGYWGGEKRFHPAELPDIDFQEAYRIVKDDAGSSYPIAGISLYRTLIPPHNEPMITFNLYIPEPGSPDCVQWLYNTLTKVTSPAGRVRCYFDPLDI